MKVFGYNISVKRFQNAVAPQAPKFVAPRAMKEIVKRAVQLTYMDMSNYVAAMRNATNPERPNYTEYAKLYNNLSGDGHYKGVRLQRVSQVVNKKFNIYTATGEDVPAVLEMFKRRWFREFMREALKAQEMGFVVLELGDAIEGVGYSGVRAFPVENVVHTLGIIVNRPGDTTGISYVDGPLAEWTIQAGEPGRLGYFMDVAKPLIFKRNGESFYSNFVEVFAMPFRVGKTDMNDEIRTDAMLQGLRDIGSSASAIIDRDDTIEFMQSPFGSNSSTIYNNFLDYLQAQISKGVVGQTGTTDEKAFVGSAEIHRDISVAIATEDALALQDLINDSLLPRMVAHGLIPDGLSFGWETESDELDLTELSKFVIQLMQHKDVPDDYILETFGIPVTAKPEPVFNAPGGGDTGKSGPPDSPTG